MKPRFKGVKQVLATCLDIVYTPLLELELWWMIGISVVLAHQGVCGYVEEEGCEGDGLDSQ